MALNDTRLRNLKPKLDKTERLLSDGSSLYIQVRAGEGKITRTWQFRRRILSMSEARTSTLNV
jgi:hypothetical protein